jgi:hypothetical protein
MSYEQRKQIEADVNLFLQKFEEFDKQSRKELLMTLFSKHLLLNEAPLRVTRFDFEYILSQAKSEYAKLRLPMKLSNTTVYASELPNICFVKAVAQYLNSKNALRRQFDFDSE